MFKLYDYQVKTKNEIVSLLQTTGRCYLSAEERFGKNLTTMSSLIDVGCKNVLFVTVKAAIKGIENDYSLGGFGFKATVINYEAIPKLKGFDFDAIIFDESSKIASYPKATLNTKASYELMKKVKPEYCMLLNATPAVESYSQFFHQFKVMGLFDEYKSFTKWFNVYGIQSRIRVAGGREIESYKLTDEEAVLNTIKPYMVKGTRKEAGFAHSDASFNLHIVELDELSMKAYEAIDKDGIYEDIIADSAVKVMSKLQQITGGFMYNEEGNAKKFGTSKIDYIKNNMKGDKIAIYARYTWEINLIKSILNACSDPYDFKQNKDRLLVQQIKSGSKGIDLSFCDQHWFYSLDFSGETFIQAIARQHNKKRDRAVEVEILHTGLIDYEVFKAVSNKKDFNSQLFRSLK